MPRRSYDILAMMQSTRDKSFVQVTMSRFASMDDSHPLAIESTSQSHSSFNKRQIVVFVTIDELRKLGEQMLIAADDAASTLLARRTEQELKD